MRMLSAVILALALPAGCRSEIPVREDEPLLASADRIPLN